LKKDEEIELTVVLKSSKVWFLMVNLIESCSLRMNKLLTQFSEKKALMKEPSEKLEKAEILKLTVDYLKSVRRGSFCFSYFLMPDR